MLLQKPESYQEIEKEAEKHAKNLSAESIGQKKLKFFYGKCVIVSDNGTKTRLPLRSREDWREVNQEIVGYWKLHTHEQLRLCISRSYFACQDRPTEGKSFAKLKGLEIHDLMKRTWEKKKEYIPHNVLETVISDQTIEYIIKENPPESVPHNDQVAFVDRVQAEGRILLAMCVHVDLGVECVKELLDKGWKDSSPPFDEDSYCHEDCRCKFSNLVQRQGGYRAARFVEGEHKTLHSHDVVPLHFHQRAHANDDVAREVIEMPSKQLQNSSSKDGDVKKAAFCGNGAYGDVHCVKMDPNHHSLSKVNNTL